MFWTVLPRKSSDSRRKIRFLEPFNFSRTSWPKFGDSCMVSPVVRSNTYRYRLYCCYSHTNSSIKESAVTQIRHSPIIRKVQRKKKEKQMSRKHQQIKNTGRRYTSAAAPEPPGRQVPSQYLRLFSYRPHHDPVVHVCFLHIGSSLLPSIISTPSFCLDSVSCRMSALAKVPRLSVRLCCCFDD